MTLPPNPVEAITRALLISDGYDPDLEMGQDSNFSATYTRMAEIAVETLKAIGWDEVEPYREVLEELETATMRYGIVKTRHSRFDDLLAETGRVLAACKQARELLSRSEVDA